MDLFLINYTKDDNSIKNRRMQSEISKIFAEKIASEFYKINTELSHNPDGSPYLKNSNLNISISHSNEIIALLFNKGIAGVDIEYMKNRNFERILSYYKIKKSVTKEKFYQIWTSYEARYKAKFDKVKSFIYKNYICSYCFENDLINIYKIDLKNSENILKIEPNELKQMQDAGVKIKI